MAASESFDYIIVGAGSAGCVLANRLSAAPEVRVLLLEAGPTDYSIYVHMPAAMSYLLENDRFNWKYQSEPEPHMNARAIACPRGRVLGGSSSINGLALVRGHALDFDNWAANALPSWSYAHCLPYFKKFETYGGAPSEYRGSDGPMNITVPTLEETPLWEAFMEASRQAGHPTSDDTNGYQQEGFGAMDQTIHNGRRWSTAVGYLNPAKDRTNLTVRTTCLTTRIVFEGTRAVGVEYSHDGQLTEVRADREVILSSGAVNSPQLLLLSGIGKADELKALDIPVVADLPGVGENLQDHMIVSIQHECTKPVSLYPATVGLGKIWTGLNWLLFKKGAGASNHFHVAGYVRSRPELEQPNLQLLFLPLIFSYDSSPGSDRHSFELQAMQLQPTSRGQVKLRTSNSQDAPVIRTNFLASEFDRQDIREGVRITREIFAQKAFDPYRGPEIAPGVEVQTDAELDAYARRTAEPNYHLSCTCKMGIDDQAVVDEELRVHGIEGLRVADASIMPNLTSGNTNAPSIMIGEKAADLVAGNPPLEPLYLPFHRPGAREPSTQTPERGSKSPNRH